MYPEPHKSSLDSAMARWKIVNNVTVQPNIDQYDEICASWKATDKVNKTLGMFSSARLHEDWCIAQPDEKI